VRQGRKLDAHAAFVHDKFACDVYADDNIRHVEVVFMLWHGRARRCRLFRMRPFPAFFVPGHVLLWVRLHGWTVLGSNEDQNPTLVAPRLGESALHDCEIVGKVRIPIEVTNCVGVEGPCWWRSDEQRGSDT
jgi:hypothetical protein